MSTPTPPPFPKVFLTDEQTVDLLDHFRRFCDVCGPEALTPSLSALLADLEEVKSRRDVPSESGIEMELCLRTVSDPTAEVSDS